jgi:predicted transcriptional regulator
LDAETSAKLEELSAAFHRKRTAILRSAMQWGLTQMYGWTADRSVPAAVYTVTMLVEPALLRRVQDAAATHGVSEAAWLRQALRQVTPEDFPASWHAEAARDDQQRSHELRRYGTRFMLRSDESATRKFQQLVEHFDKPRAAIFRQLAAQATSETFPESWHQAVTEQTPRPRRG